MTIVQIFDNESYRNRLRQEITSAFHHVCKIGGTYRIEVHTLSKDNTPRIITKKLEFEPSPTSLRVMGGDYDLDFANRLYEDLVERHNWTELVIYDVETEELKSWLNKSTTHL